MPPVSNSKDLFTFLDAGEVVHADVNTSRSDERHFQLHGNAWEDAQFFALKGL